MNDVSMALWFGGGLIVVVDKWVNDGTLDVKVGIGGAVSLFGIWAIGMWSTDVANSLSALILVVIALTYGYDLAQKLGGGAFK